MQKMSIENKEYYSKNFYQISLVNERIETVVFEGCTFNGCDFSQATLYRCKFIDCTFNKCNMSLITFDYSRFSDVLFTECKMIGIDWVKVDWPSILPCSPVSFIKCILNDSSFFGLELKELIMDECKLHEVDFKEANLFKARFEYSDLDGCLFSNSNLQEASFVDAKNYNIDINNNKISRAKFSRFDAVALLESLDIVLED